MLDVRRHLKKLTKDERGISVLWSLVTAVLVVLIIAIIVTIGPMIGSETESAVTIGANSQWNVSVNTDLPQGYDIWEVGVKFTKIGVIIGIVVAAVFAPLMGFMIVRRYRG
jgi:hypothetical protein